MTATLRQSILMRAGYGQRTQRLVNRELGDTTAECCTACVEAVRMTRQPGTTPFNNPFVGRPLYKLQNGDVIRSFGSDETEHVLGDVTRNGRQVYVQWRDRPERELLQGAIALCVLRDSDLPNIPGAGLMAINGELVEMV